MMARKQAEELSYGIIGLGRFGSALASTLAEAGKEIMVLDCNEEKVRQIRNFTEHAYVVKDLQKETLRETGIQNCDVVVVCIGDKVDVSILTTLNVTNLGSPRWWPRPIARNREKYLKRSEPRWCIRKRIWPCALQNALFPKGYLISLNWTITLIFRNLSLPPGWPDRRSWKHSFATATA